LIIATPIGAAAAQLGRDERNEFFGRGDARQANGPVQMAAGYGVGAHRCGEPVGVGLLGQLLLPEPPSQAGHNG